MKKTHFAVEISRTAVKNDGVKYVNSKIIAQNDTHEPGKSVWIT